MKKINISNMNVLCRKKPDAFAEIKGNSDNPLLRGTALFYNAPVSGTLVQIEIFNLPDKSEPNHSGFFGMHIHEIGDCTPPFDKTGSHYNPNDTMHPEHAGDMPSLLSNDGYAWTAFYDSRIIIADIIGRSIIIHGSRDDFTSQPSGDSGIKIGCGVIEMLQ